MGRGPHLAPRSPCHAAGSRDAPLGAKPPAPAPPRVSTCRHRPQGHPAARASVVDLTLAPGNGVRLPATACLDRPLLLGGGIPEVPVPLPLEVQGRHDVGVARPATVPAPETAGGAAPTGREPLAQAAAVRAGLTGPGTVPFDEPDPWPAARWRTWASTWSRSQCARLRLVRRLHDKPRSGRYGRRCSKTNTCNPAATAQATMAAATCHATAASSPAMYRHRPRLLRSPLMGRPLRFCHRATFCNTFSRLAARRQESDRHPDQNGHSRDT